MKSALDHSRLDRVFNPKCVAVVGDKAQHGFFWLEALKGYQGKLYSVQVNADDAARIEAMGVKNYLSLLDIPEPVDLVIASVPKSVALRIVDDCVAKGAAGVVFFTSGMSETGAEEGRLLEQAMAEKARGAGLVLIGPNCMGVYNPRIGLRHHAAQPSGVSGPIGLISQSGTHANSFSIEAHIHGLDIGKSVSYGNGAVFDSTDFLEYFGQDPSIEFVGMYIEGVRDGRRFFQVLRDVSSRKPVLIWKGGTTDAGFRAIASHTASLAVSQVVWNSMVNQCGAIGVENAEDLLDTLSALVRLPSVKGNKVAIVGGSGGESVGIADAFAKVGLPVPRLSAHSLSKLAEFFSEVGASYRNPIDPGSNRDQFPRILEILEEDPNIDNLVLVNPCTPWRPSAGSGISLLNAAAALRKRTQKPIVAVLPGFSNEEDFRERLAVSRKFREAGIPSYPSFERGAKALKNAFDHYRPRPTTPEQP